MVGVAKGNPGLASIGGVIRDSQGNLVARYVGGIGVHSSMVAKSWALLKGANIVVTLGIKNLKIEGDSKTMIDSINLGHLLAWDLRNILLDINILISKLERYHLAHIFWEGNQVAYEFSNLGST